MVLEVVAVAKEELGAIRAHWGTGPDSRRRGAIGRDSSIRGEFGRN